MTMFVTTFPCHNCAKHIIAAGIRHVVYLEPYPKSRADVLHKEEIELESKDVPQEGGAAASKVVFTPYSGIAPRQYQQLFGMSGRGKKGIGPLQKWNSGKASHSPQYLVANAAASYLMNERDKLANLPSERFKWVPSDVIPPKQ